MEEEKIQLLNNFIEELNIACKSTYIEKVPLYIFAILYFIIIFTFILTSLNPITIILPCLLSGIFIFLILYHFFKNKYLNKKVIKINKKYQSVLSDYYLIENNGDYCEEKEIILISKEDLKLIKYQESVHKRYEDDSSFLFRSKFYNKVNNVSINKSF